MNNQTNNYPSIMKHGLSSSSDSDGIANLFATNFGTIVTEPCGLVPNLAIVTVPHLNDVPSITQFELPEVEVLNVLSSCDAYKRGGPDGIPGLFLKSCAHTLATPLTLIFNKSLQLGICPARWKVSSITPILKKGDPSNVENYRPISKQNMFMKSFERLLHTRLSAWFSPFLSKAQHGFTAKRSTTTNLARFTSFIAEELDNSNDVHAIYTDFSKAFDRVNPNILIAKLERFGVRGSLLDWFKDYLTDRSSYVAFNGSNSSQFVPVRGVPQGSILGPLLFLIFINDLPNYIHSDILLFADDAKIFRKISSLDDCTTLQTDLDRLSLWCSMNQLDLNVSKCSSVCFSRKALIVHKITQEIEHIPFLIEPQFPLSFVL